MKEDQKAAMAASAAGGAAAKPKPKKTASNHHDGAPAAKVAKNQVTVELLFRGGSDGGYNSHGVKRGLEGGFHSKGGWVNA